MQSILKLGLYTSILLSSITLSAQLTITSGTSLIVTSSETVTIVGDLDNAGNLSGKGTITVGGDFGNTGVLGVIIGPDQTTHTTINVTGTSTLGGSFTVTNDAYVPVSGDEAVIITSGNTIGSSFSNTANNTWFANYNTPSLGDFTISYQGTLPVELLYFTGKSTGGNTLLNWETRTEINNLGFEIQHSNNGNHWQKIDFVAGQGTSTARNQYEFIDTNPFAGLNYYRLKSIDFDGAYDYSNILVIQHEGLKKQVHVFPNPSRQNVNIHIQNPSQKSMNIRVTDQLGRIVWESERIENTSIWQEVLQIKEVGIYFIGVQMGNAYFYERVVIVE